MQGKEKAGKRHHYVLVGRSLLSYSIYTVYYNIRFTGMFVGTVPNGTNNNIVDKASYNHYSVLGEIDWLENES